jgi:competence protein ComEC
MVSTYQWNIDHIDIYFLDVSQGDATIIHSQECVIVIDAFNYVSETLKGLGEKNIDYLFITHDDLDHNKELPILMHDFNVKNFISHPYSSYPYRNMMHVSIPQKITCHDIEIEIINPNKDYLNDNDNSLILLLTMYQHKFLFLGDASKEVEMDIMNAYADHINNVTILKIGHHGSKTSSDLNFLLHVNPIYALISVGRFNRYGMPHQEVLDNLNVTNTTTLRTDQLGTIIFTIHQDELNYAYMKP